jgi:hypothetical protein
MKPAYHAIFVSLATGMLVFSFVSLTYRVWLRPYRVWLLPSRGRIANASWDADAADLAAFFTAALGTVFMIVAMSTGLMARPLEALLNSPITKNKILVTILAIVCWLGYLLIRSKAGPTLWERRDIVSHAGYVFALAGALFLLTVNSIGGDLAGIPSGYEEFAKAIGFRTRHALYFPTWFNALIVLSGLGLVAVALKVRRRSEL